MFLSSEGHVSRSHFYCRDRTPRPKAVWRGNGLFQLAVVVYHGEKLRPETQGWKLETGTEAEAKEECCLARQWWYNL